MTLTDLLTPGTLVPSDLLPLAEGPRTPSSSVLRNRDRLARTDAIRSAIRGCASHGMGAAMLPRLDAEASRLARAIRSGTMLDRLAPEWRDGPMVPLYRAVLLPRDENPPTPRLRKYRRDMTPEAVAAENAWDAITTGSGVETYRPREGRPVPYRWTPAGWVARPVVETTGEWRSLRSPVRDATRAPSRGERDLTNRLNREDRDSDISSLAEMADVSPETVARLLAIRDEMTADGESTDGEMIRVAMRTLAREDRHRARPGVASDWSAVAAWHGGPEKDPRPVPVETVPAGEGWTGAPRDYRAEARGADAPIRTLHPVTLPLPTDGPGSVSMCEMTPEAAVAWGFRLRVGRSPVRDRTTGQGRDLSRGVPVIPGKLSPIRAEITPRVTAAMRWNPRTDRGRKAPAAWGQNRATGVWSLVQNELRDRPSIRPGTERDAAIRHAVETGRMDAPESARIAPRKVSTRKGSGAGSRSRKG